MFEKSGDIIRIIPFFVVFLVAAASGPGPSGFPLSPQNHHLRRVCQSLWKAAISLSLLHFPTTEDFPNPIPGQALFGRPPSYPSQKCRDGTVRWTIGNHVDEKRYQPSRDFAPRTSLRQQGAFHQGHTSQIFLGTNSRVLPHESFAFLCSADELLQRL